MSIDRYAVFGNPIKHSRSPVIHRLFAEQTGQTLEYSAELVALDSFNQAVKSFARSGGKGLNITVPFKQNAFEFATALSKRAQQAGAVNTLIIDDADYYGDNTDGVGLQRDLTNNHQQTLQDKRILILGAGGASRGALGALLTEKPAQITIANRTVEKAINLAKAFSAHGKTQGCGYDDLTQSYDIIINATAASLQGELPPLSASLLNKNSFCYDMMYAKAPTVFMQWAQGNRVTENNIADGLGMLVEQAAESFYLWRDIKPETRPVIDAVRALL